MRVSRHCLAIFLVAIAERVFYGIFSQAVYFKTRLKVSKSALISTKIGTYQ